MQYRYVALASFAALAVAAPVPSEEIDWNNTPEVQDLAKRTFPFFNFWKEFLPTSMRTAFQDNVVDAGGQDDGGDSDMAKRAAEEHADPIDESKFGHHPQGVGHHGGNGEKGFDCYDLKHGTSTQGKCKGHHKPPAAAEVIKRAAEEQVGPTDESKFGHHPKGEGHHGGNGDKGFDCYDLKHGTSTPGHCIGHHPPGEGHHKGKPPAAAEVGKRTAGE